MASRPVTAPPKIALKEGELIDDGSNMLVCVRVRPYSDKETQRGDKEVVRLVGENLVAFDPPEDALPGFEGKKKAPRVAMHGRRTKDVRYGFDCVFGPESTQEDVYNRTAKVLLGSVLEGYNASVFAYGATGAGKTHTMCGSPTEPGVMVLAVRDLFSRMEAEKTETLVDVAVSYLEVYNETIRDLLRPSGPLSLREDARGGPASVSGLSMHKPETAEELFNLIAEGNTNRTQHATDANANSSRSHGVLQIHVHQRDRTDDISKVYRIGKLTLVDLAGSERASATRNCGMRMREGANINRSLLALGNVINALVERKSSSSFVPYRDSKLTRLLKDSLGGNCRTVMIANVSPSYESYEDTHNTLKYANRAKNIRTKIKRNVVSVSAHVSRYEEIIRKLREEIQELKKGRTANGVWEKEKKQWEEERAELKRTISALEKKEKDASVSARRSPQQQLSVECVPALLAAVDGQFHLLQQNGLVSREALDLVNAAYRAVGREGGAGVVVGATGLSHPELYRDMLEGMSLDSPMAQKGAAKGKKKKIGKKEEADEEMKVEAVVTDEEMEEEQKKAPESPETPPDSAVARMRRRRTRLSELTALPIHASAATPKRRRNDGRDEDAEGEEEDEENPSVSSPMVMMMSPGKRRRLTITKSTSSSASPTISNSIVRPVISTPTTAHSTSTTTPSTAGDQNDTINTGDSVSSTFSKASATISTAIAARRKRKPIVSAQDPAKKLANLRKSTQAVKSRLRASTTAASKFSVRSSVASDSVRASRVGSAWR